MGPGGVQELNSYGTSNVHFVSYPSSLIMLQLHSENNLHPTLSFSDNIEYISANVIWR